VVVQYFFKNRVVDILVNSSANVENLASSGPNLLEVVGGAALYPLDAAMSYDNDLHEE